ncbi:reverse transcriptase domain-containing protein [Tanacetum coccineum]
MFKQLRLEIGLKDALVEMPKFNKWLSSLLRNKEKLEEIAITTVNAECSAIIMNKVPEKLEDPGKFLIPCALQELNRTSALADSGASINLLPHSIYKKLRLEALTPTRMTLELANRSITHPMGIAENVVVRVDGFTFLADFVVVNFEPDPRVPIILGRPFLRTAKALIDLYKETLTLRVGKEELVYYADKSEKNKDKNFVHTISVIDFLKADPFSGSTTNTLPPSSSPVKTSDNFKKFADELSPLDSLPPENDKDVKIKSYSSFTLTSPKESELIPPGIDLTLPPTLEVSSSNPTSPTLTGEKKKYSKPEPSFLLPPPKPPDECLNFEPNLVMKNVVLNEDFYQSKKTLPLNVEDVDSFTFIIWTFLPYFTYTEESPLIFSFRSENFVFDPGIITFHNPVAFSMEVSKIEPTISEASRLNARSWRERRVKENEKSMLQAGQDHNEDCNMKFLRAHQLLGHRVPAAPTHSAFISAASTNSKWSLLIPKVPTTLYYTTPSSSADASGNVLENVLHSFVAKSDPQQQITYEDFDQIGKLDLEELDIKWQMAMLSVRINRFEKKAGEEGESKTRPRKWKIWKVLMVLCLDGVSVTSSDATDAETQFALMGLSPQMVLSKYKHTKVHFKT